MKRTVTKKILSLLSLTGIVATFVLAGYLRKLAKFYEEWKGINISFDKLVFLWISMVPLVILLYEFYQISKFLKKNMGFENRTIKAITGIKICAAIEFFWYLIGLIKYQSIEVFVVFMGTAIVYIFAALVKEVLMDGQEYYEDSNLAI